MIADALEGAEHLFNHLRWSRDGRQVCIDSMRQEDRHMRVIDVSSVVDG